MVTLSPDPNWLSYQERFAQITRQSLELLAIIGQHRARGYRARGYRALD